MVTKRTIVQEVESPENTSTGMIVRMGSLEKRFDKFDNTLQLIANNSATTSYVDKEVATVKEELSKDTSANTARIEAIERNIVWVVRLLVAAVILTLLANVGLRVHW